MKLSVKASFLLTGLVLAVIAAMGLFLFSYQQKEIGYLLKRNLESETASLSLELTSLVDENLRDMAAIAGNLPRKALKAKDLDAISEYLARQVSYYPKLDNGLFILDRDGRFMADFPSHPELRGQIFLQRDYFQRTLAQKKGVVGDPYISTRAGLPVITLTAPIKSASGQIEAVVCGSVSLLSPSALGGSVRKIGKDGYAYVVDRNRKFLIHPDKSRIMQSQEAGLNVFLDRAAQGFEGTGETVNSLGVSMLIASRQIADLGWVVLAQVPEKEILASMHEAILAVGLFFFVAVALVLPVGFMAMRRIVMPLEALETAAQIITQDLRKTEGALTRPFASSALAALRKLRSSDEIGKLARAFFQLSVRLKQTLTSLRSAAEDWERTFSSIQEGVLVLDRDGKVLRVNRAAEDLFRTNKTDAIGQHWREVLAMGQTPPEEWPSEELLRESMRYKITSSLPEWPGMFELSFSTIQGRKDAKGILLIVTEVTEKIQAEERIRDLAFHDLLTRLPNRLLLSDRLEQAIATADRNTTKVGVLFLDLDNFKQVNDTFGHQTGDELLKLVTKRIGACLRSNDTLARYAGDEFVAVLMDLKGPSDASAIAVRMLESLEESFDILGKQVGIGASIGIAIYPLDGASANMLLHHADTAMYRAKGHGKNSFWFAESPEMASGDDLPKQ